MGRSWPSVDQALPVPGLTFRPLDGTQLRLVVTARIVQRVLILNGLDRLIPVCSFWAAAIAAGRQQRRCR